ncbi:MAG: hypothetical protein LUG15_03815, partial [Oscillospiraceae bacterium]|nr:hypothetical protein [Oscillospiraceae bacterium]
FMRRCLKNKMLLPWSSLPWARLTPFDRKQTVAAANPVMPCGTARPAQGHNSLTYEDFRL